MSSLISSQQTTEESSAVYFASYAHSSLLPTSKDCNPISTPNSNLTSHDMMGIINRKLPEFLYLPNDFLPTQKNQIDEKHGKTMCTSAVHFDRSLTEKNPNDSQMESSLKRINMFYEEVNDNLTKFILSHLMVGCNIFLLMGVVKYPHCYFLLHSNSDETMLLQSQYSRKHY